MGINSIRDLREAPMLAQFAGFNDVQTLNEWFESIDSETQTE